MSIDNGGPVFPLLRTEADGRHDCLHAGMLLRDLFAGMVLLGWASSGQMKVELGPTGPFGNMATWAYQVADAMIVERERGA